MNKKFIITLSILGIIILIAGIILLNKNEKIEKENQIEIIDATYTCAEVPEKFYENDKYTYYFPCVKSSSVYVKLSNGNKMLVTNALSEEKVTIDELLDAGLEVIKEKK